MRPPPKPLDLRARPLPAGVERDWLQKDANLIWHVRSVLPPSGTASAFLAKVEAPGDARVEEHDLGFGFKRHSVTLGGGYASCTITATSHDDALLAVRVDCNTTADARSNDAVRAALEEAFGRGFSQDTTTWPGHVFEVASFEMPAADARARAALDRELGALTDVDPKALPQDIADAYATLMSPQQELAVGRSCGFAGVAPLGREATTKLESAGRVALLRNVLRGPNPEARVYAARALARLGATTAEDRALLKKLAGQAIDVRTCSGCIYMTEASAKALRAKDD